MKPYVFVIPLLLSALNVFSQKFQPAKKYKIDTIQIAESNLDGKILKSVKSNLLKEGYNYLQLGNDRVLYIERRGKKINSFVLTKYDGTILEKIAVSSGRFSFECGRIACGCLGTADCDDLLSTGLCGATICVDNALGSGKKVCICIRN